ncbi:MAG TPA: S-layer homology domain-containing protein [Egibacteraceae bacterium]|nr:S-layer homology domain-containing protein [Egibacteraceae bacterium]
MISRSLVVLLLSVGLLLSGLGAPVAGAEITSPTVAERLDGLPLGEDAAEVQERLRAWRQDESAVGSSRAEGVAGAAAIRSRPTRTPIPFSMVGFEIPPGAEVGFRTSSDGHRWSPWQWAPAVGDTEGPDPGTAEAVEAVSGWTRSEGHWVGDAEWLQLRVLNGRTEDVGVDLIDSLGLSRSGPERAVDAIRAALRPAPAPAAAAPERPRIISRAEWGADESLRSGNPSYAARVRMGVLHHTASSNDYTQAEAPGVLRAIYRYHTVNLGWSDIGYNLLVDRFGTVYEGRAGGVESGVVGAHARDWNTGTFGVSVIGCFDSTACAGINGGGGALPAAVEESLVELLAWKLDVHSINVDASIDMNGATKPTLTGHRDVGATACPGDLFYAKLGDIRRAVLARQDTQGGVVLDPGASPSTVALRTGSLTSDITFSARLRPPGPWRLIVSGPDGGVVHAAAGSGETAVVQWSGGSALRAGTYTYEFSSDGRRPAAGPVKLEAPCEDVFCDLGDSVHKQAILRLHERGVVSGCADGRFCPSGRVTRGQMATMTARALGLQPQGGDHFTDVPSGHAHAEGINALYEGGIVQGDGGRFLPNVEVRRDQMATFIRNGFGLGSSGASHFRDVAGNTHEAAINALAERGITTGDGSGRYLPERQIRRDQIASLLDRALQAAP